MSQLAQSIFLQAQSLPEGGLLSPKEFLHMGSRAAIDQTLSRLAREGKLLEQHGALPAVDVVPARKALHFLTVCRHSDAVKRKKEEPVREERHGT